MAQIICLANSFKRGGRCIAGIDLETGNWIRPIGSGHEGAIGCERLIDGTEPHLLDVLNIPIGNNADNLSCQPENRILQSGPWKKVGEMTEDEVMQYIENTTCLLHNNEKKVFLFEFQDDIPESNWKSLQLIHVENARFYKNPWNKTECSFSYSGHRYLLPVLCPEGDEQIGSRGNYLLTISMGGPYRRKQEDELACWKMVAGVIELD